MASVEQENVGFKEEIGNLKEGIGENGCHDDCSGLGSSTCNSLSTTS